MSRTRRFDESTFLVSQMHNAIFHADKALGRIYRQIEKVAMEMRTGKRKGYPEDAEEVDEMMVQLANLLRSLEDSLPAVPLLNNAELNSNVEKVLDRVLYITDYLENVNL